MKFLFMISVAVVVAVAALAAAGDAIAEASDSRQPVAREGSPPPGAVPMAPPTGECTVTAEGPIEIPFRIVRDHVLIPVSVNGSPPLELILDTGMPVPGVMLHPCPEVDAIKFNTDDAPQVIVAGGGDGSEVSSAVDVTFELPGVVFTEQMAIISPPPGGGHGEAARGVIGLSIFDSFVVTFDHERGVLVLTSPDDFHYDGSGARLPLKFGQVPVPEVDCVLETGGREVPVSFVVDTGATFALSITPRSDGATGPPPGARELMLARSYWGQITGLMGRVDALRLGHVRLEDVVASYVEAGATGAPPGGDDGILGNETLRRFNATFDYSRKELILEPFARTHDRFEFNMSGAAFRQTEEGGYEVLRVFADTPAADTGLQESDIVVAVNGRPSRDIPGEEFRAMLIEDGATLKLDVKRGSETIDVELKLRRLV